MNISSKQPRKKRLHLYSMALHEKRNLLRVHVAKALKEKLKRRNVLVKRGDKVKIMTGGSKGKEAKVVKVSVSDYKVFLEGFTVKKSNKREKFIPFEPSNLMLIEQGNVAPKEVLVKKPVVGQQ